MSIPTLRLWKFASAIIKIKLGQWSAAVSLALLLPLTCLAGSLPQESAPSLELTRPLRPWEFLPVTGQSAALLGNEAGRMEAWVYPLKLLRDLHLILHIDGAAIPAESLARSLTVRPEATMITYAGDSYTIRETFFVPVKEKGAVILFEIDTEQPLEIEVVFHPDFQLEWPGAIGGTYLDTLADAHAFGFGEESHRFAGLIGSPSGQGFQPEYQTNYSESNDCSFRLGVTTKGKDTKLVVIAGSTQGLDDATKTYWKLASSYRQLMNESAGYYRAYLERTVRLELPDSELQRAYDWARVSTVQGLVSNPDLGTGLVAGYRTSGESQRPGFAWFFGRDALWTSFALNACGDLENTKTALAFLSKFQREDGKIPHEISQAAGYVAWFKDFPYGFASADATPLYIIAMDDYLQQSGETAFIKEKWTSIWKAYEFLRSTRDAQGFPKNLGVGHGWVEGGPLVPVKTELYQTALGAEALRALADMERITGQKDAAIEELDQQFVQQKSRLNESFWVNEKKHFAYALDPNDRPMDELSVLATVPMWFGILDENRARQSIAQLADLDHQTDWGMRIISSSSPKFSGEGYHYGSVWPLFTGWASVGEYRYHREQPAYTNLRANALLAFDGSLGHVTEVLSGTEYQSLSTSSPHQIWSAAMVVSPILRGLFGIQRDALNHTLRFAPHAPADWPAFQMHNVRVGATRVDLRYRKTLNDMTLEVTQSGTDGFTLDYQPALSLRAKVLGVELNGRAVPFQIASNDSDQHVVVHVSLSAPTNVIRIRVKNDFGFAYHSTLPSLGNTSQGLRVLSETWSPNRDALKVNVSGLPGGVYDLAVWNPREIVSLDGAKLVEEPSGGTVARIQLPGGNSGGVAPASVAFHFEKADGKER